MENKIKDGMMKNSSYSTMSPLLSGIVKIRFPNTINRIDDDLSSIPGNGEAFNEDIEKEKILMSK
jgi:hypothetical protein